MPASKSRIRADMRRQRRQLTDSQQRRAGDDLARQIARRDFFLRSRRLAFYLPNDGEIDPGMLMSVALAAGKRVYLPKLDPFRHNRLHFLRYLPDEPLRANRYGIPEPRLGRYRAAPLWSLDIIFLPLVAFDGRGQRLGMGGGYYDRSLAPLARSPRRGPLLIGLAHHFQETDALPAEPWDIPLHAIATDRGLIHCPGA
jgi:5-formyltetrahydrofolate cyclo-ligase